MATIKLRNKGLHRSMRYTVDSKESSIVDNLTGLRHNYGASARGSESFFQADEHRREYTHQDAVRLAMYLSGCDIPLAYNDEVYSTLGTLI